MYQQQQQKLYIIHIIKLKNKPYSKFGLDEQHPRSINSKETVTLESKKEMTLFMPHKE